MKYLFLAVSLLSNVLLFAQTDPAAKYSEVITQKSLKQKLSILAADNMEGRETGSPGQRKAASWIASQFERIGLKTCPGLIGYQQFYPLYKDSLIYAEFSVNGKQAVYGRDFMVNTTNVESENIDLKGLVFAGFGIEDSSYSDYTNLNVKDKLVVFMLGEPSSQGIYRVTGTDKYSKWTYPGLKLKIKLAAEKGARAVMVINPASTSFSERMVANNKQATLFYPRESQRTSEIPYGLISLSFAKQLFGDSLLENIRPGVLPASIAHGEKPGDIHLYFSKQRETIMASNVVGFIEGSEKPNEYLLLTAHYDHLGMRNGEIYNGADDDGSGSTAVIQMAEAFMAAVKAGHRPKRSVVFMTVSGEEKGLWGSEFYSDNPVFPLENTTADLNTDMIGRIDTERKKADTLNYIYVVGHDKLSTDLQKINEAANKKYTNLVLDYKFDDLNDINRIYYRSDHYNFARKGVPVLFFYDGMLKSDYHQPTDTVDKIEWKLYEKRARMIFLTAWEMANRDDMLVRDIPLPAEATAR
jgi:hypothetical protein